MKYFAILILLYVFIKSLYYGFYEINEQNNKARRNYCYITFIYRSHSSKPYIILYVLI